MQVDNHPSLVCKVGDDVLRVAEESFKVEKCLTDDTVMALHSVYGNPFERALELLERNCVVFFYTNDRKRCLIQVSGTSGMVYTLFPSVNYCSCTAYRYHVVGTRSDLTCKHILVAKLCEIMGKGREMTVSANEISSMLCAATNMEAT